MARAHSSSFIPPEQFIVGLMRAPTKTERWAALRAESIEHKFCILTTLAIAGALVLIGVLLLLAPVVGAVAAMAAFALLAVLAIRSEQIRTIAVAASALPAAIMASLAWPQHTALGQVSVLYAVLLLLTLAYYRVLPGHTSRKKVSRKHTKTLATILLLSSTALGVAGAWALDGTPALHGVSLPLAMAGAALFALTEELYFRGLLQKHTRHEVGPTLSVFLATLAYGALTIPLGNVAATSFALVTGLLLACMYYVRPRLLFTLAANLALKTSFVVLAITFFA